jgi:hypothetical protein
MPLKMSESVFLRAVGHAGSFFIEADENHREPL